MGSLNDAFNTETLGFRVSKSYFDGTSKYRHTQKTILLLSNWFHGSNSIQSKIACMDFDPNWSKKEYLTYYWINGYVLISLVVKSI